MAGGAFALQAIYIKEIPIAIASDAEKYAIETLVDYVIYLTAQLKDIPSHGENLMATADDKLMLSYFEQIIDAVVLELYIPNDIHEHGKHFIRHLLQEDLPKLDTIPGDKMNALRQIFRRLYDPDHPIRTGILSLDSVPAVRVIRGMK